MINNRLLVLLKTSKIKSISKFKEFTEYFLVLFITMILTYIVLRIDSIKWDLPISYYWDGLAASFEIKTILDTGWWFRNPYVGAPFGTSLYDFLGFYFDSFYFFIIKIILFFTKNWGMTLNIFYISLYPFTSLISYFVMKKFKINFIVSLMGSLMFTFLEYRFLRGGYHLLLSAYNLIPLIVLFLYYIYINERILILNKKIKTKKNIMAFVLFLLLPTTGVYYTFFTCFFLLVILIMKNRKIEVVKKVFIAYSCILLSVFIIYLPGILYKLKNLENLEKPSRLVLESEFYGLRFSNLFISKKIVLTSRIKEYFKYIMESGENSEYLGIIGIIGFLYLIYYLFKREKSNKKIEFLSYLNIFGILLSIKSGFGVLFSIYITGLIRGYGRISVFIAYFSILAICIKINDFIKDKNKNKLFYIIFIGICSFSIWDQIPRNVRYNNQAVTEYDYKSSKEKYGKEFDSDKKFVSYIETKLGENGMVFQLPYFKFPEAGYVGSISDYQLIKGYLHSKKIKWSYGAYKGRKEDLWNRQISNLSLPEILESISIAGFNGIYIDKRGYNDEDYQKLEKEITFISGSEPYFSDDKNLVFFDIKKYSNLVKNKYFKNGNLEILKDKILNEFISTEGIYSEELLGENRQTWAKNKIIIYAINDAKDNRNKIFNFNSKILTPSSNTSNVVFDINGSKNSYIIDNRGLDMNFSIKLKKGRNVIKIETDAPRYNVPDSRELYIKFENLKMQIQ